MLIVDTSGLVAYFDKSDRHHPRVADAVEADDGPFVVSPYVVAELDYLLGTRRGVDAQLAALSELAGGAWDLPTFGSAELASAADVVQRYHDQRIGVADASLVILAERYETTRLLTLDRRHFSVVRARDGSAFTILP